MTRLPRVQNIAAGSGQRGGDGEEDGELIGYARVSTAEQSLDLQVDALLRAGVDDVRLHREKVSGVSSKRPGRDAMLRDARPGDTIVVWKLDRLGRSMYELINIWDDLAKRGIRFRSLTEGIDTKTSGGRMLMHILAALAQFERDQIAERTAAGIKAKIARGHKWGPEREITEDQVRRGRELRAQGVSRPKIAAELGISEWSVHHYIISKTPRAPVRSQPPESKKPKKR